MISLWFDFFFSIGFDWFTAKSYAAEEEKRTQRRKEKNANAKWAPFASEMRNSALAAGLICIHHVLMNKNDLIFPKLNYMASLSIFHTVKVNAYKRLACIFMMCPQIDLFRDDMENYAHAVRHFVPPNT